MVDFKIYVGLINREDTFKFLALIQAGNKENEVYYSISETTSYRGNIVGLTKVLNTFNDNDKISIYTPVNFGFLHLEKMIKGKSQKKWINRDIGEKLANIIKDKKLNVDFINYGELEPTELTKSLKAKLIERYPKVLGANNKIINININKNENKKIYNENDIANTEISICTRGVADTTSENREGKYICILNFKGREKELIGELENTTANRMIIQGLINSIKLLKVPCKIKLYTHTSIGLSKYSRGKNGVNNDLLEEVFKLLKEGNHSLEEFIGNDRQMELINKLKDK